MSSDEKGLITIITNMAATERRKTKRKSALKDELEKPTKEEYAVAKHLRFNAPSKEGKFLGNSVQYFIGSKIIDAMLDSKWATKNQKTPALFTTRSTCANYCQRLLEKGFFHRVAKLTKKDKERSTTSAGKRKEEIVQSKRKEKKNKKDAQLALESKPEKEGEEKKTTDTTTTSKQIVEKTETMKEKEESTEDKKRKKKKLKLELHDKQDFLDGPELYVWIYDPVPVKTFIIGLFLVFGAIAVCLFPLWPPEVKIGIYYLSLAAAGFIGLILALCIVRMVVFVIVWLLTIGKVSFWLLPNLTEDVGFFESFLPVWKYELKDAAKKDEKPDPDSAKNVDPIGPANEETSRENDDDKAKDENGEDQEKAADVDDDDEDDGRAEEEEERVDEEEDSEEEEDEENKIDDDDEDGGRRHSSSNENGYEIIDKEDVQL